MLSAADRADGSTFAEAFERRIEVEDLACWRDVISVDGGEDGRISVLRGRHGPMMLK